jgi:serine/threonine protein kinase
MGQIVEAVHEQLGTRVAIKVMREERARRADNVERFLREARAAAQLKSEHVCRVHDFGTLDDGAPYMVMELLDGRDLATVIRLGGGVDPGLAARYMLQVCTAIAEAHALGIIHRDLKPANLFVVDRPDGATAIKVLDFGIAKSLAHELALTDSDSAMGSPYYMSPEQIEDSKHVDARTDIWAMGVVMFELLVGRPPFEASNPAGVALAITTRKPAALPPGVPKPFGEIVRRCLQREPGRRYADVAALASALEPLATSGPKGASAVARVLASRSVDALATVPALPSNLVVQETTLRRASGEAQTGARARSRWPFVAAIAGALAIGSAVTAFALRGHGEEPAPLPPPANAPPPVPVPATPPIDAAPPRADAAPIDAAPVPIDAPPAKRPIRHNTHQPPPDYGRTRY